MVTSRPNGNGGGNNNNGSGDAEEDPLSNEVFQGRARHSQSQIAESLSHHHTLSLPLLLVIAGPTGVGKSTVQKRIHNLVPGLRDVKKDQTRTQRVYTDPGRERVTKTEFKKRKSAGKYILHYSTAYKNDLGVSETVHYGILEDQLRQTLKEGDSLVTLTDPDSYRRMFSDDVQERLREFANVVPIIMTTGVAEDLITRLEGRICDEKERERRLQQVGPQREFFDSEGAKSSIEHIIINDSPESLRNLPLDQPITDRIAAETYGTIDNTLRKFAGIIHFYRELRRNPHMFNRENFNVHYSFVNMVSTSFFGSEYAILLKALEEGSQVSLVRPPEQVERIKQKTKNPLQVENILGNLVATRWSEEEEGILKIHFNELIRNIGPEVGKAIFSEMLPEYGFWRDEGLGTKRYTLTDVRPASMREGFYAIDMKLY